MLGEAISMLVPQVVGFRLHGALPEGATATDLVLTVTQILRADRRRREVRRVLRRGSRAACRSPTAPRSGTCRPSTAPRAGSSPSTPRRSATSGSPGRSEERARARRGVLQGERPLARPRGAADVLAGGRARPLYGRAVARRPAAAAGPDPAARREAAPSSRRCRASASTTATATTRRSRSRSRHRIRPPSVARARRGRGGRARAGRERRRRRGAARRLVRDRRRDGRARPRRRRDRRDHVVHEHVQPGRDDRRRAAREEGRRARADAPARG